MTEPEATVVDPAPAAGDTDAPSADTAAPETGVDAPAVETGAPETGADAPAVDLDELNETLEYIRPALQADGGDLILLGVEAGRVTLQLVGACGGCPMSTMTLTAGIERILRDRVAGVEEVVAL